MNLRVLAATGVGGVMLLVVLPGSAVSSMRDAPTPPCDVGGVQAVIDGKRACLWAGLRCRQRFDSRYRRYGFACTSRGLTIVSRWRIRDIGSLPGFPSARAMDINERGDVVGASTSEVDDRGRQTDRVFLWRSGRMQDITAVTWPAHVKVAAINDAGQVLETLSTHSGEEHAFEWENGVSTDLGTLGGAQTHGTAINAHGEIVGWSETDSRRSIFHAFSWGGGKMHDLGTLGGKLSSATAINASGQVVGWSYTANGGGEHVFLSEGGEMRDVTLDSWLGLPVLVNDQGLVVGTSYGNDGGRAFRWEDGARVDLGLGLRSSAALLNNRGQVVTLVVEQTESDVADLVLWNEDGSYRDLGRWWGTVDALSDRGQIIRNLWKDKPVGGLPLAFIEERGRPWILGNLGLRGAYASALNEHDQIVGAARTGARHYRAVIWTRRPNPRP